MTNHDTPGVDWQAKHAAAGTNAKPTPDRPHDCHPYNIHTISDSDITTNPINRIEDTQ